LYYTTTPQENSFYNVLQSSEKSTGVGACEVKIVLCGQQKKLCSVFLRLLKVFKSVFVFLKQAPPEDKAVTR
jgi:hypothetical protein